MTAATDYYQHSRGLLRRLFGACSLRVRREIGTAFLHYFRTTEADRVLDVGVSAETDAMESNAFERFYPYPSRLIAVGLDLPRYPARQLQRIRFVTGNALELPFHDGAFELAVSHATIEHVGSREQQVRAIAELLRVAKRCMVTTPNRNFPLELHTFIPLLHYLPPAWHRRVLKAISFSFYAREENLNLLTKRELRSLFPPNVHVEVRTTMLRTNIIAFADLG